MDLITLEERLRDLGHELPSPPGPAGRYRTWRVDAGLLMLSGQVSRDADGVIPGPITGEQDLERAAAAATAATLACLAQVADAMRHGHRVEHVVSLRGFVASTPDFTGQPAVVDVASRLLVDALGEEGEHVRTALGVAALPGGSAVELELTARCAEDGTR